MSGWLVGCMILSWLLAYFAAWKGLKSTGKMVYFTCLCPYVILLVLLIWGATLPGCGEGLAYLFTPNWERVFAPATWHRSATQILFSSGVCYGPFMFYGSARQKNDKLVAPSFWIPFANSATSLFAAITLFLYMGYVYTMLHKINPE